MKKGARYGPFFMRKLSVILPEMLQGKVKGKKYI